MQTRFGVHSAERVAAVRSSALLDSGPEEAFDRIVRLASTLLSTTGVVLTVLDDMRSVVKGQPSPGAFCAPDDTFETPVAETACQVVVDTGAEVCAPDVRLDDRLRDLPQIRAFGVHAWLGTPINDADGYVLGNLCAMDTTVRDWTDEQRESLQTLARAASGEIALRQALRDSERHAADAAELAATLEESLVPTRIPRWPGIDIGATFRAGGSGVTVLGDFYDLIPRGARSDTGSGAESGTGYGGEFGVVIGDVSGHGPQAARTTAMARSAVRTAAHLEPDPTAVLRTVNEVLTGWFDGQSGFVTATYARLRPAARPDGGAWTVEIASAGHPPSFVVRAHGDAEILDGGGTVLGVLADGNVATQTVSLAAGDSLVLYTDGITEARPPQGDDQFDEDGVLAVLTGLPAGADAQRIAVGVADAASAHAGGGPARDDAGVLVVRIPPTP